jgi:hypothetical protein
MISTGSAAGAEGGGPALANRRNAIPMVRNESMFIVKSETGATSSSVRYLAIY